MAPKRRVFANTNVGESSNPGMMQIDQLAKMIQGYEEKNNATAEMMMEMKKVFDEKSQALERYNDALKQKAGRSTQSKTERDSSSQSRKTKEESEVKIVDSNTKSLESSVAQAQKLSTVVEEPVGRKKEATIKGRRKRQKKRSI